MDVGTTKFTEVSAVSETAPCVYSAEIHPNWSVGGKPHGGYLLAMLARAAVDTSHHPHVLAASANYVRSPQPGPAIIRTELLRNGRSAGQVRAWLEQDGEMRVMALITTGELEPGDEPFWSAPDRMRPESSFDASVRVPAQTPVGMEVLVMGEVDLRLDPSVLNFAVGKPSGSGLLHGWLSLEDGENFDPFSLLFAVDSLPPATFEVALTGWVPTIELTAYIRALPAPGPLQVLQRAQLIEGQKVDETCLVWDCRGRLVAQATQLAGIRVS
jgi:hypothetical protein